VCEIMDDRTLQYLIRSANQIGLEGDYVERVILPDKATLSITDTIFIINNSNLPKSATEG